MSWIFGAAGKISDKLLTSIKSVHEKTIHAFYHNEFYIACGGLAGTFHFKNEIKDNHAKGIAVTGTGLKDNGKYSILNSDGWLKTLINYEDELQNIDGHYCGAYWSNDNIVLFSDPSGIYDIYYLQYEGGILFSTDVLLLNSFLENSELNFEVFASRWLSINQFSSDSIIRNAHRISKGEMLCIEQYNTLKTTSTRKYYNRKTDSISVDELISGIFSAVHDAGFHISLSLSGGIDSRLLLSILTSHSNKNFSLHTFGSPLHPDSVVASRIASELKLTHNQLYSPLPSAEECITLIKNYIKLTMCINPCSIIFQLKYYPQLYDENNIIIDGGFGEIGRRQYLNRLLYKEKSAILNKEAGVIFKYSALKRAEIFREEIHIKMREAAKNQIDKLIYDLPDANEIGAENWLDIFSYNTRLPNFFGIEQKRMGNYVINLMPFGLKRVFDSILNLKINERKNGKEFKKIISRRDKRLTEFPLAKYNAVYPFDTGLISSRLRIKYNKLKRKPAVEEDYLYLQKIKEFVFDLLNSVNTRNYEMYDYKKVSGNIKKYFDGDKSMAEFTDWWLSFEILRRYSYKIQI